MNHGSLFQRPDTPTPIISGAREALIQSAARPLTWQPPPRAMTTRRASPAPSGGYSYRPPNPTIVQRALKRLWNNPPKDFSSVGSLGCIAVSIYHEARNQPIAGQAAVATVILNRAANPERWGGTPCGVVQPVQFSYLRPDRSFAPITNLSSWNEALEIAAEVLKRGPDPKLEGADHYHATYVNPPWNQKMDWIAQIKDHIFWRSRPTPL